MERDKKLLSTKEAAEILGISRVAVFKKIQKGEIKAFKIGRAYVIPAENLSPIFSEEMDDETKKKLSHSIDRVVKQYGEALKKLGDE